MQAEQAVPDRRKVFIIHGRNLKARHAVAAFLRSLGLEPLEFDILAADLGTSAIADIVRSGMAKAQAIVALFTPDEIAFLSPSLSNDSGMSLDGRWQSRPNVIFEAGMAFSSSPERTIIVTFGSEVTLFSDVDGIHILRLNNKYASRAAFRQKLIGTQCSVDLRVDIYQDPEQSGDFESCLTVLPEVSTRSPFRINQVRPL